MEIIWRLTQLASVKGKVSLVHRLLQFRWKPVILFKSSSLVNKLFTQILQNISNSSVAIGNIKVIQIYVLKSPFITTHLIRVAPNRIRNKFTYAMINKRNTKTSEIKLCRLPKSLVCQINPVAPVTSNSPLIHQPIATPEGVQAPPSPMAVYGSWVVHSCPCRLPLDTSRWNVHSPYWEARRI